MKQKLIAALLALACLFSLAACGKKDADPAGYTLEALDLMTKEGAFSEELEELDADTAFALYRLADWGLSREDLTDCKALRSAGATCEEEAVLLWQTEEQAVQAKEALEDYIQGQIDANVDYRPAEIPKLEEARVSQVGSTVLMVVADDMAAACKAVPYLDQAKN